MYDDVVTHTFGCVCVWGNKCMSDWYTRRNDDTFCRWYLSGRRYQYPWVVGFILFKNLCAFFFLVVCIRFASFIFHLLSKLYCWYFCNSPYCILTRISCTPVCDFLYLIDLVFSRIAWKKSCSGLVLYPIGRLFLFFLSNYIVIFILSSYEKFSSQGCNLVMCGRTVACLSVVRRKTSKE